LRRSSLVSCNKKPCAKHGFLLPQLERQRCPTAQGSVVYLDSGLSLGAPPGTAGAAGAEGAVAGADVLAAAGADVGAGLPTGAALGAPPGTAGAAGTLCMTPPVLDFGLLVATKARPSVAAKNTVAKPAVMRERKLAEPVAPNKLPDVPLPNAAPMSAPLPC
jgi:hypothetical protein